MKMKPSILMHICQISKSFTNPDNQPLKVLDQIDFKLHNNEIIALVGKSGSGKSTLTRIMTGLEPATSGQVLCHGKPLLQPSPNIAMVFQNFALMPWLSVLENVELGLEAQGISKDIRRKRSLKAIDTIGLDGFESAYPKELSGGMRQRVGFARALVVDPEILIMDEPFSALDILTAENLRNDLLELWLEKQMRTKGIILVTHDIEEAILMANRILIFSADPGQIRVDLPIHLPFPRDPQSSEFRYLVDKIYTIMTISERERLVRAKKARTRREKAQPTYAYRLPQADISELTGLLEAMETHEKAGEIDIPNLAEDLHLDINSLFPLTEALDMLHFIKISSGHIAFTEIGRQFEQADILERKQIFSKQLTKHIPLARHIRNTLDTTTNHQVSEGFFLEDLENYFSEDEAERILKIAIDWGRYAELFAYDYDSGLLSLENPT